MLQQFQFNCLESISLLGQGAVIRHTAGIIYIHVPGTTPQHHTSDAGYTLSNWHCRGKDRRIRHSRSASMTKEQGEGNVS